MKKCAFAVGLLAASMLLFQCYYVRQGVTLLDIYGSAEDMDRVLERDSLAPEERRLLESVKELKAYAVTRLGLAENKNYSTYIHLNRDYLAAVVSASDRLSFRQYRWKYIFVGELPYQGFFNAEEAKREARLLEDDGYDVYLRPVDAFSTLGILSDPVFSFMKDYPESVLADLIFHEQTHATIFLVNQATFNENIAMLVGGEGMRQFLKEKYGAESPEYKEASTLDHDRRAFARLLKELHGSLDKAYAQEIPPAEKSALKEKIIDAWKVDFRKNYALNFLTERYARFPEREINNAIIMTHMNYTEMADDFHDLFTLCREDLPLFIRLARALKREESHPLPALRALIEESTR